MWSQGPGSLPRGIVGHHGLCQYTWNSSVKVYWAHQRDPHKASAYVLSRILTEDKELGEGTW